MKGLVLSGYACNSSIWDRVKIPGQLVEWPREIIPNFSTISEFSRWVKSNYDDFDFIVGHSRGGLVALDLCLSVDVKKIILVESFIKSPSKFFQNIVLDPADLDKVMEMLKQESKYFSPDLAKNLREIDLSSLVSQRSSQIHCIYGDRSKNSDRVFEELAADDIKDKLNLYTIKNCCHFPMIENPQELENLLNKILSE